MGWILVIYMGNQEPLTMHYSSQESCVVQLNETLKGDRAHVISKITCVPDGTAH